MVKHKHKGVRSKTRHSLKKSKREKGRPKVNKFLQEFKEGDKVHIIIDPSVHKGMPHRRFNGKTGTIVGRRGEAYLVKVRNILAWRTIIVHPAHLKLQKVA